MILSLLIAIMIRFFIVNLDKFSPSRAFRLPLLSSRHLSTISIQDTTSEPTYHVPVMLEECCKYLNIVPGGVYVDCTLGGGGHTKAILERGGKVIGIDQDPDAIKQAQKVLATYISNGNCEIIQTNFRNIRSAIQGSILAGIHTERKGLVDGVLMDLGVSSYQINEGSRGFAFGQDGPLDMRMNKGEVGSLESIDSTPNMLGKKKVISAHEIINTWDGTAIADVLYNYGDEVRSRILAREIISARPLNTTAELVNVISSRTSFKERSKTLARCFQALRIVVNDEMGALEDALQGMHECLRYKGSFVVMSYHSLEDRKVKQLFRTGTLPTSSSSSGSSSTTMEDNIEEVSKDYSNPWYCVTKRAVAPTDEEIQINRRARSAKLRAATQMLLHKPIDEVNNDVLNLKTNEKRRMGAKELAKLRKRMGVKDDIV